ALNRKLARFSYDVLDGSRTRRKRTSIGGSGDVHLTESRQADLREICRDMMRNNPLINGVLKIERDEVVGEGVIIQARTDNEDVNRQIEDMWYEEMEQRPVDVRGQFDFSDILRLAYLSYRRDGDFFIIFLDDKIQAIEGDQVGTPYGDPNDNPKNYEVINGVAYSKTTLELLGYYIGQSDQKYGYIKPGTWKKYPAAVVHHWFNPERSSLSRGEPALTSAINYIDKLDKYYDAELVAATVNACYTMFVAKKDPSLAMPAPYTGGMSSSGYDSDNNRLEKIEPGVILYGEPGESATGIGNQRPGGMFEPFVLRTLSMISRPLCFPLMLMTGDYSGATFMNARIAYQQAQKNWRCEQKVISKFVSRTYRWKMTQWLNSGKIKDRRGIFNHEIYCNRWPYVDPTKEADADRQQIENRTLTRTEICAKQGRDFNDVVKKLAEEEKILESLGLTKEEGTKA
ncbi:MAG TPA: phage portal protein, partial [Clostridiales bacterium]|nr:phage portal protein [Clostridiales bacterium]